MEKTEWKETAVKDFFSSLVVFLVALPLCLGIALASGLPPITGLISGVIGGLVVGSLSGCPLQASGPAAGLITIVADAVLRLGFQGFTLAVMIAGGFQLLIGILGFGPVFRGVSPAVIKGMLSGIGAVIFASQFHVMVDDTPASSALVNLATIPRAIGKAFFPLEGSSHHYAAMTGLLTIGVILLWTKKPPRALRALPPTLAGVLVAIAAANGLSLPIKFINVPADIWSSLSLAPLGQARELLTPDLLVTALAIAFIASAETLLTATAVDQMSGRTKTDYNKEVRAQGVGNMLAGAIGCPPITGVIVRSAANVQAGARTRASTVMHGLWLLLFITLMPGLLAYIPVASLAAILVFTGIKLMNPATFRQLAATDKTEAGIFLATVATIVATNLLAGIVVGFALATCMLLYRVTHVKAHVEPGSGDHDVSVVFHGTLCFMNLPKMERILDGLPPKRKVHILLEELAYMDHAAIQVLHEWGEGYRKRGGQVSLDLEPKPAFHAAHLRRRGAQKVQPT